MAPTLLKKDTIKSTTLTTTTTTKKPHPTPPDPIVVPPSSTTIQSISNHFSKLYANHKILASSKGSHPNTHFQEKGLNNSCALDNSCVALTKSSSQHGRIHHGAAPADLALGKEESNCTKTKVKEKDNKKYSLVNVRKKPHQEVEVDAQKPLSVGHKYNYKVKKSSAGAAAAATQKGEKEEEELYHGRKDANKASDSMSNAKKASDLMSKSIELEKFNETVLCEMKRPSISLAVKGRRRSFCCSQTELADFFSCTGVKVVAVDMPPFMQIHAVDYARKAYDSLEKFTSKTLAFTLKKEFDGVYGPAWHCIIGTSFGSFVTHSVGGFMYFSMDHKLYILLFKTTVQRAG